MQDYVSVFARVREHFRPQQRVRIEAMSARFALNDSIDVKNVVCSPFAAEAGTRPKLYDDPEKSQVVKKSNSLVWIIFTSLRRLFSFLNKIPLPKKSVSDVIIAFSDKSENITSLSKKSASLM